MEDNKSNFEVALYSAYLSNKYNCLTYYGVTFISRSTAEKIIEHFGLISMPAFKMRKGLDTGTIYVHPENINKY